MATKYFNEVDVLTCIDTLLELKNQPKDGFNAAEVLDKSKDVILELLEAKIPVKTIVKHFHEHNLNIPANVITKYIASIRPKTKTKRKAVTARKIKTSENKSNVEVQKS